VLGMLRLVACRTVVVACRIVGGQRRTKAWRHSLTAASVRVEFELLVKADMQAQAVRSVVVQVWAFSVAEEALALEVASLCLLWVACVLHQSLAARLLHPT
jgi:hypothetical protein